MTQDIDTLAQEAYLDAMRRQKTGKTIDHWQDYLGIREELQEFCRATELGTSDHLPQYTEAEEELADVTICCMTELTKRGVQVGKILHDKIKFNQTRD